MMKSVTRIVLSTLLLSSSWVFAAADGSDNPAPATGGDSDLKTYLLNLGQYFGYDLTTKPSGGSESGAANSSLLNLSATKLIQNYLFNTMLGALPVNTSAAGATPFVPANSPSYSAINAFANYTFSALPYSSESAQHVSVSSLLDQPSYQADPVSQAVLNIIGTPNASYCLNNEGTALAQCTYASSILNQNQVMENAVGSLPDTQSFFTYNYNKPVVPQLNSNSLISPLLYTTETGGNSTSSDSGNTTQQGQGLTAQNQSQLAANFIRYVTAAVMPLSLPSRSEYDKLYQKAQNADKSYPPLLQSQAQATLSNYLAKLRVYAAQSSVAIGNLYYILSKRLPQSQGDQSGEKTSQALSEFKMASWRLFNPDQSQNSDWLDQINKASGATVQKEIATLLAEINYQLYLGRQQQERLLLTNSILLLQNRDSQPAPSLADTDDTSSSGQ